MIESRISIYIRCVKKLRNIALYTSAVLLMLHSFIPHQHSKVDRDSTVVEHQLDILDLLSLVFIEDLGEDHLTQLVPTFPVLDFAVLSEDLVFRNANELVAYPLILSEGAAICCPPDNLPARAPPLV